MNELLVFAFCIGASRVLELRRIVRLGMQMRQMREFESSFVRATATSSAEHYRRRSMCG